MSEELVYLPTSAIEATANQGEYVNIQSNPMTQFFFPNLLTTSNPLNLLKKQSAVRRDNTEATTTTERSTRASMFIITTKERADQGLNHDHSTAGTRKL